MEEEWAEIGRKSEELAKQVGWDEDEEDEDDADDDMGGIPKVEDLQHDSF